MSNKKTLTDEEVLRFQRFNVAESTLATYEEASFDTQLSIERGVIWLIHAIEWITVPENLETPAANNGVIFQAHVARETKSGIILPSDSDCIAYFAEYIERSAAIGTDAGPLYWHVPNVVHISRFELPIPYASQNIYIGVISTNGVTLGRIRGRIHYTIRTVSDQYFYRVAQSLLG